jgi:hypothetical protein
MTPELSEPARAKRGALLRKWKRRLARHVTGLARAWRYSATISRDHGPSQLGMLSEAAMLALRGRMQPETYFLYRLFDPSLPEGTKRRYLSDAPRANERLWALLTPPRYRSLFDNKLIFNRFFTSAGLPLATVLGVFDPLVGRTAGGESLRTELELARFMRRVGNDGFVFKPVEGMRGNLVLVFTGAAPDDPGTFLTLSGDRYDAAALVAAARDPALLEMQNPGANTSSFLIEERIRPHPSLAEFIGPTLCTIRIVTIVAVDGSPRIIASVFKLQPKPVGIDHLIHGALACWVDPGTGALCPARSRFDYAYASVIPGTDRSFVGYRLPCWPEVKQRALEAAAAFPWARAIGWDIAISDRGPVLIEGNDQWATSLVQLAAPYGLMDGELKTLYDTLRKERRG